MSTLAELSDTPKYNIKAVCAQTGIRSVTLRAWERRYKVLTPHRTDSNYRLYSDRDVAVLRWLKSQVDNGMSISSAVVEFKETRRAGKWPEVLPPPHQASTPQTPTPPVQFANRLFNALTRLDESAAGIVLSEAHAIFDLTTVCLEVIMPCLVKIGEGWHDGKILISTEHFASNYLRGRLTTLLQSYPAQRGRPRIIIGCAPDELHDIGGLMLALLLRRDGYRVDFLGAGVPAEDIIEYVGAERPAMLCLSASTEEAARELGSIYTKLSNARLNTKFGFGGRAFIARPALQESIGGLFLGETILDASAAIRSFLG